MGVHHDPGSRAAKAVLRARLQVMQVAVICMLAV